MHSSERCQVRYLWKRMINLHRDDMSQDTTDLVNEASKLCLHLFFSGVTRYHYIDSAHLILIKYFKT